MTKLVTFLLIIIAVIAVMSHSASIQARPVQAPPAFPTPASSPVPVSAS